MTKPKSNGVTNDLTEATVMQSSTGDVVTFDSLLEAINATADESLQDPEELQRRFFNKMMEATSIDELLSSPSLLPAADIIGQSFWCTDVKFNESDFVDSAGVYAVIEAKLDGKDVTIGCGARTVLHQLLVMKHRGWLPAALMINKATKPTEKGYFPLSLGAGTIEEPF